MITALTVIFDSIVRSFSISHSLHTYCGHLVTIHLRFPFSASPPLSRLTLFYLHLFLFLSSSSFSSLSPLSLSLFLFSSSPFQPTFCVLSFLFFLLFLEYFPFLRAFARTVILTLYYTLSVPWYNYPSYLSYPRDYESVPDPGRRLYFISLCLLSVASDNTVDSSGIRDIIQSDLRPSVGGRNSLVCGRMSPL